MWQMFDCKVSSYSLTLYSLQKFKSAKWSGLDARGTSAVAFSCSDRWHYRSPATPLPTNKVEVQKEKAKVKLKPQAVLFFTFAFYLFTCAF
jgi:hypothetical protein